jgi:type II secretory pathway pseudopilin PulG
MLRHRKTRSAFSLVELLVVLGILVVITAILLPAVMRGRRAGQTAQCMNNLRQFGNFYLMYAQANDDYLPIGTDVRCPTPPEFQWRTDWNDFITMGSAPASAGGVLLCSGTINRDNGKILFCPISKREELAYDVLKYRLPEKGKMEPLGTIKISYAVRPVKKIWYWSEPCPPAPNVAYPSPMPKLHQMINKAIIAEPPERPPYNHGTDADPRIHVLFYDGAVRLVPVNAWAKDVELMRKVWFQEVDSPQVSDRENGSAMPVWEILDKQ